ncbi:MAG: hypothetical protein JWQ74_339 [Marmoricola sp.]|nr:hypothetical protein [Marmoricola sp.]
MSVLIAASPLGLVARWSTRSQEQARRNAMAACTVLTARRIERAEVEEFVAAHLAQRATSTTAPTAVPITQVG